MSARDNELHVMTDEYMETPGTRSAESDEHETPLAGKRNPRLAPPSTDIVSVAVEVEEPVAWTTEPRLTVVQPDAETVREIAGDIGGGGVGGAGGGKAMSMHTNGYSDQQRPSYQLPLSLAINMQASLPPISLGSPADQWL
jgi:hypothetical protein